VATYKLIQDIEAEDKILGPLTLRQFIFGMVAAFFFYISFLCATKGVPFLLIVFLPPGIFCGFFAFPFGRDQPTEIWFLAKLRFWFLPRQRVWNQSGVKEMVTITVPKKIERVLTNGLSETEVKSRLQALANTIDSRGWAIKNVNVYTQPMSVVTSDDRLIDLSSLSQDVPEDDAATANDIMDLASSPIAQQVDNLVYRSTQAHHQQLIEQLNAPPQLTPPASSSWFMGNSSGSANTTALSVPVQAVPPQLSPLPQFTSTPILPAPTAEDELLSRQLKQQANSQDIAYAHMRTMQPIEQQPLVAPIVNPPQSPTVLSSPPSNPALMALARNNDLNVATIAREAQKTNDDEDRLSDEVVVSLH
jgi:hypothetical protein